MKRTQSSVSRRLEKSLDSLMNNDYESALVHFFPALDKTAKLRRPKDGVGSRIKKFLDDEEAFITYLAFRVILTGNDFDGLTFSEAIYKFGRTSVMHEGELDPRLTFDTDNLLITDKKWMLPPSYIHALIIAVMTAKENEGEFFLVKKTLYLNDNAINDKDLWGNKALVQSIIKMPKLTGIS